MSPKNMPTLLVILTVTVFFTGCNKKKSQIETYDIPPEHKHEQMATHDTHAHEHTAEESPPSSVPVSAPKSPPAPPTPGKLSWTTPDTWTEQPVSGMRAGSFLFTGENGQTADISIINLSGDAGGLMANVNRWRGQLQLDPLDEAGLERAVQRFDVGGREMALVEFVSDTNLIDDQYKKRLVAGVIQHNNQSYFFKMTGEDGTVTDNGETFLAFLEGIQLPQ